MKLLWTKYAKLRREEIFNYIAADNSIAALQLDEKIEKATKQLALFPKLGRQGRVAGSYEFVVEKNYIIIYEIHSDCIVILTIHHSAQQYLPQ